MKRLTASAHALVFALAAMATSIPAPAEAGCGCAKPPPPRAVVRPFVGHVDQRVVLFSTSFVEGTRYSVRFISSTDGSVDWSKGKAAMRRDFADGLVRAQLRVVVPSVSLGPCEIRVFTNDQSSTVLVVPDDQFTVTSQPVALHDFNETVVRNNYQAGVGKDGTVYISLDVGEVSGGTTFSGNAIGYGLKFGSSNVAMYNEQGFLMQLLDPTSPGLFQIVVPVLSLLQPPTSYTLNYWRHEFRTYKQDHRVVDAHRTDDDPDWHSDGTPHIDHNRIVVAVSGTLPNGSRPQPGATPPFQLQIQSSPAETSPLL